jgi:CheY-like chemotaxis protein
MLALLSCDSVELRESGGAMPGKRVLVVDDSALIRQVLSDALSAKDYTVVTAADGAEALRLIAEDRPDLVIADILMPEMDGWALCEQLRRAEATCNLPLILLTTERDVPKRIKGLEMGADDYVCKPFSKEEVVARVDSLLRRATDDRRRSGKTATLEPLHLMGHTDHIGVPDLLQLMGLNGKSGTLHLRGRSVGRIFFRDGQIINAELQGLRGKKALFRIMAWPEARFEFEPGDPARQVETALDASTSSVLMEGFAQIDELRSLSAKLPPLDRRLRPAGKSATGRQKLSTTQRIIIRTAKRGATLEEIIDTVPDNDLDAYIALDDLLRRGVLEPLEPDSAA